MKMKLNKIYQGDCLEVLKTFPDNSVDSVVTDPPYGIGFMGKEWDNFKPSFIQKEKQRDTLSHDRAWKHKAIKGKKNVSSASAAQAAGRYDFSLTASKKYQDWCYEWAKECLRVLKPGGHLLASNSPRMYHRMACAIEDAGFDIRDQIQWIYGSGFPKSLNIGNGWGTALKPANEPIVLARKPLSEDTVAKNVLKHGTGGINIEGCKIGNEVRINGPGSTKARIAMGDGWREDVESVKVIGRWPANLIHDGLYQDWAKFFYTAKASKDDRNQGLEQREAVAVTDGNIRSNADSARKYQANSALRKNIHPTVKPTDLMRYLVRLVTPPRGIVLDPFMGSGSTGKASVLEGFRFIGIEREKEYIQIAEARIKAAQKQQVLNF